MSESLDNSFKSSPESSPTHDLTEQNPSHSGNGSFDHPEPPSIDSAIEADDLFHSLNSEYKVDSSQSTHAGSQEASNSNDFEDELRVLGDAINGTSYKDEVDTGSAGETGNKRKRNESLGESSSAKRFRSSSSVDSNLDVNKDDDAELAAGSSSPQKSKKQQQEDERLKMQLLVSNFSEDQLNRYEMFRRAAFPKAAIKRLMQSISCTTVSQSVVIAMSGIAKVFVGEIVESALDVMDKQNQSGPLQPKHIREAVRRMRSKNNIPTNKYKKKLFR